jgi:hypothetical protein
MPPDRNLGSTALFVKFARYGRRPNFRRRPLGVWPARLRGEAAGRGVRARHTENRHWGFSVQETAVRSPDRSDREANALSPSIYIDLNSKRRLAVFRLARYD